MRKYLIFIILGIGLLIFGTAAIRGAIHDKQLLKENNAGEKREGRKDLIKGDGIHEIKNNVLSKDIPACPSDTSTLFTKAFMDGDKPDFIVPLGNSSQQGHVIPTDHVYPSDFGYEKDVPVYAPSDITLVWVENKQMHNRNTDAITGADYQLNFAPCRGINLAFIHLKKLSEKLDAAIEDENTNCNTDGKYDYGTQNGIPTYYQTCHPNFQKIRVPAGEVIGYFSGYPDRSLSGFDIGLYDYNKPAIGFANSARYYDETNQTVCFADYYVSPLREKYYAKFGSGDEAGKKLIPVSGEPKCGKIMFDIPGTASGDWFKNKIKNNNITDQNALVLMHDNLKPEMEKFTMAGITSFTFAPMHTGSINREFSEVKADGKIYCYQGENNGGSYVDKNGQTVSKGSEKYLIQLISDTQIKTEKQVGVCGTSEAFVNAGVYER